MNKWLIGLCLILLSFGIASASTTTTTLTFAWNSNTETDLDGYGLYCGFADGTYDVIVNNDIPVSTTDTVTYIANGLLVTINAPTYCVADAFDVDGNRSGYSNVVSYTHCVPLPDETQTLACPAGQTGSITQRRTSSCVFNSMPVWSAWAQISNTCKVVSNCTPTTQTRTIKCTKWYEKGSTTQKRTSICNADGTITWGAWTTVSSTCRPWYSK
jgi:hypothetical protein